MRNEGELFDPAAVAQRKGPRKWQQWKERRLRPFNGEKGVFFQPRLLVVKHSRSWTRPPPLSVQKHARASDNFEVRKYRHILFCCGWAHPEKCRSGREFESVLRICYAYIVSVYTQRE